jgi:putative ATP-dependent endonuclease of OLD family
VLCAILSSEEDEQMIIQSVNVQNFRCLRDVEIICEPLTVLVGSNGAGKSSLLRALALFYDPAAQYDERDYYAGDTGNPIGVQVTFADLTEKERELFAPYIDQGMLSVEKEMSWPRSKTSQKYYGSRRRNPEFAGIREASGATPKRQLYNQIRTETKYAGLPPVRRADEIELHLQSWEREHAEALARARDSGQFFGFREVGESRLERFTRFLLIPAVRDATDDATETKGSVLTDLMELLVRSALADREDLVNLRDRTQRDYDELVRADRLPELQSLEAGLCTTLQRFAPDARVELDWHTDKAVEIPLPDASVILEEDGYGCEVGRAGHGLQRAFILTILQHLAVALKPPSSAAGSEPQGAVDAISSGGASVANQWQAEDLQMGPNLILGIEEPELYQHPSRQRHWSKVLLELAQGSIAGVAQRTQVIYSTHSPLFVDVERFDQMRVLRKRATEPLRPKCTEVAWAPLSAVARDLEQAADDEEGTFTSQTLRPRLRSFMRPEINEAFFAEMAVLVEGQGDKAAILAAASLAGADLESMDISVVECGSKTSLDKGIVLLKRLGIPIYVVWDGDKGNPNPHLHIELNHRLLRLLGQDAEDFPARIGADFACFECTLDECLRTEIGRTEIKAILDSCKREFQLARRKDALKNATVMETVLSRAQKEGRSCGTLTRIVEQILEKRARVAGAT